MRCQRCGKANGDHQGCLTLYMEFCKEIPLDLETTGLDLTKDRPWQIHCNGSTWLINPEMEIEPKAKEICGVDEETLQIIAVAPTWNDIAEDLFDRISDGHVIVAYNGAAYDIPILIRCFDECGFPIDDLPPVIDPKIWAIETWPDLENHKLKTVYTKGLGMTMDGIKEHDAAGDCQMMSAIWAEIRRLRSLDNRTLRAALSFQAHAAQIQKYDWDHYQGVTPQGAVFLWIRTCRHCFGKGSVQVTGRRDPSTGIEDCEDPAICWKCNGYGVLNNTKKRRGTPIERGYANWALQNVELPEAVKNKFIRIARS